MDRFQELTLELTDWCPLECIHCSSNSGLGCGNRLETEFALELVTAAARLGAEKISFGGGEPTACESFRTVITRAVDLGMSAEVFTCGLGLAAEEPRGLDEGIIEVCKELVGAKFIFSIHGATAETHDHVTQMSGSFDLLLRAVEKCLEAGIECEMNYVPMRVNMGEFAQLVGLAGGYGIKKVSVLRFVPQGRGLENRAELEMSRDEETCFVEGLMRLRAQGNVEVRTGSPFNGIIPGNAVPCRAGSGKLVVQANGNVLPCEVFKHHRRCEWNLSVHRQSLSEILQAPQLLGLRDMLQNSACLECPVHSRLRTRFKAGEKHVVSKAAVEVK